MMPCPLEPLQPTPSIWKPPEHGFRNSTRKLAGRIKLLHGSESSPKNNSVRPSVLKKPRSRGGLFIAPISHTPSFLFFGGAVDRNSIPHAMKRRRKTKRKLIILHRPCYQQATPTGFKKQ